MEHRRTTAALTTSPHGLANDVSITTHTPSTHTHTSYHRTPFTTIHLLHHNLPAQPTAPPPDPPHDRLSPRPPPVSSPPPLHGCSKTVSSVRCFVIGFLLAAHLPSSRAHPGAPRGAPRAGGGDLRARRASSDTLLATACSWTCRATIPTLRLHIVKDTARRQFTVAPGTHPQLHSTQLNHHVHAAHTRREARRRDATACRYPCAAQRRGKDSKGGVGVPGIAGVARVKVSDRGAAKPWAWVAKDTEVAR